MGQGGAEITEAQSHKPLAGRVGSCGPSPVLSLLSLDEIMSQFPCSKMAAGEQKEEQPDDEKRPSL